MGLVHTFTGTPSATPKKITGKGSTFLIVSYYGIILGPNAYLPTTAEILLTKNAYAQTSISKNVRLVLKEAIEY